MKEVSRVGVLRGWTQTGHLSHRLGSRAPLITSMPVLQPPSLTWTPGTWFPHQPSPGCLRPSFSLLWSEAGLSQGRKGCSFALPLYLRRQVASSCSAHTCASSPSYLLGRDSRQSLSPEWLWFWTAFLRTFAEQMALEGTDWASLPGRAVC